MFEEYKIEHVPVLKNYRHPTNPLTQKQEVKFYYHHKYMQFVRDYKVKHGIPKYTKTKDFPLCLGSFRVFLAFNNLWWLINKDNLTVYDLKTLNKLNLHPYIYNFKTKYYKRD